MAAWGSVLTSGSWTIWTIKDAYSLPCVDETLDSLQVSQWFSSLDLKLGYWQVEMDEESKALTAFTVGLLGFYECKRMPFGLTNAPTTFQSLIETCLGDLNLHWCIIYLDDIVIFSKDLASHLERQEAVLWKLEEAGLKLNPSKCELFQWQIAYLGYVISTQGVATDEGKIEAIKKWPTTNKWSQRSKLFWDSWDITISLSLNSCTGSPTPAWVNFGWECWQEKGCHPVGQQVPTGLWWPEKTVYHHAYSCLYMDFTQPFKLHTDACGSGLGAVLYQTHEDGTDTVIAYASRSLSKAESHYSSTQVGISHPQVGSSQKFHMNTCMGWPLTCTQTIIPWPTCLQQPSWMQPVTTGWPAWQTTISSCTTKLERQT